MADQPLRTPTAGAKRATNAKRITRAALAVCAIVLLAVVVAALRPLPTPPAALTPELAATPSPLPEPESITTRETRLAQLAKPANIFAKDRTPWPSETAGADPEPTPEETTTPEPQTELAQTDTPPLPETITLTERPSSASRKSRDALQLMGVYVSGDVRAAMIKGGEPDRRKDTELYHEDDIFYGDTWRLLRVVPEHDRVILEHLGQGDILALSMYAAEIPTVTPEPVAAAEPAPNIAEVTTDQARQNLLDAGVDPNEVAQVFDLLATLQRDGELPPPSQKEPEATPRVATTPTTPADAQPAAPTTTGGSPEMPPALAELLRSMVADTQKRRQNNNNEDDQ